MQNSNENNMSSELGSLERLGIPVETSIDPNVLSFGAAKAIRFRISKPKGYSLQEVDDYIQNIVTPSLEWYMNMLHQRDRAVHQLGSELDLASTDVKNLKSQISFLEYNSQVKSAIDMNTDDKEVAGLMQKLQETQAELTQLKNQAGSITDSPNNDEKLVELNTYIEQITQQYNELLSEYEKVKAELENNSSQFNAEAEALTIQQLADANKQYTDLMETYKTDLALASQKQETLQNEYDQLKESPALNQPPVDNSELVAQNAALEEYSSQVATQYGELMKRYKEDTAELQKQLSLQPAPSDNSNETATQYAELEEYSKKVVTQYGELMERYEEDTAELQKQLQALPSAQPAVVQDNSKYLNKIEELEASIDALNKYVKELESEEEADNSENKPKLQLATVEKNKKVEADKYKNLPPGIRPEDLE